MQVYNHKQRTASENSFSQSYLQEKVQKGIAASVPNSALIYLPCEIDQPQNVNFTLTPGLVLERSNVLAAGSTADDFALDSGASVSDDAYNGMYIFIDGHIKLISDYDATGGAMEKMVTTTETDLPAAPAAGTAYQIYSTTDVIATAMATGDFMVMNVGLPQSKLTPVAGLPAHAASAAYRLGAVVKATPTGGSLGAYICIVAHTSTAGPDFDTDIANWQALPTTLPGFIEVRTVAAAGAGKSTSVAYAIYGIDNQ